MTVALAFLTLPGVIVLAAPAGTALADVCASAGRRISVGGCVNIADAVAPAVQIINATTQPLTPETVVAIINNQ